VKKVSYDLVEKALLKIAEEQDRTTLEEVASEVGIPPSSIEPSVYRLVQKHGWKTSKTKLGDVEIDFNKPFDPGAMRFGS
jgi:DNA-binding Lrp family transcriptional regulator